MKWPYDDCEPPDRIYIGRDVEDGKVIVTWFILPTMADDICYIRKDLVNKKIQALKESVMSKPHSVTVSIVSSSDGEVNQKVILEEFASSAEELTFKNFTIADKVVAACQEACRELAGKKGR